MLLSISLPRLPPPDRMKDVAQEQYTQAEAERGAGMTKEKYPPAHPAQGGSAASASAAPVAAAGDGRKAEAPGKPREGEEAVAGSGAALGMDVTGAQEEDPDL